MFQKRNILFLLLFIASVLQGQTRVKAMFYNLLNYDTNSNSQNRTPFLKNILDEVEPDIFMVCELKSEAASNYLYNNAILPFNPDFKKAEFKTSQSPATDLLQMVYYNSKKLTLETTNVNPTNVRDINQYTFVLNTENKATNPTKVEVYVTHLKASRGLENRQKREESIFTFVRDLERISTTSNVIFAGDFNFYTSNEPGFQKLIDNNNRIQIIDPINRLCPTFPDDGRDYYDADYDNTYFWNNSSFADIHSQSTRNSQLNGDGAGGGMDDRFDFIMLSKNFTTSSSLYYITDSYKTIGNNGNCYNSFVSNSNCTGEYSSTLRNALFRFSDHLPIVLEFESQENILNSSTYNSDKLTVTLKNNNLKIHSSEKIENLKIVNILGQLVLKKQNFLPNENVIDISNLKKGIYFLKVNQYKTVKILKY